MHRKIGTHSQAVAGVIEALLMVALVSIVISVIQLVYIPQIMEQREAEHMDEVSNQFSYLKSVIDTQAMTGSLGTDTPLSQVPMSSVLTLGSSGLPYFITAPSYGVVSVINDENCSIELPSSADVFPLTSIIYRADNSYFVDQNYVLEGGGIILGQPEGTSTMRADPSISVKNLSDRIEISMYLPNIIEIAGKNTSANTGKCFIRTNYSSIQTIPDVYLNVYQSIIFKSQYPNAWNESLNRLLGEEVKNGYVSVKIGPHPTQGYDVVLITVLNKVGDLKYIDLKMTLVNIYCQIGPGWIT